MDQSSRIGQKIRELRKRMKMTQAELAGSDFTKSFISQVEKGVTRPSLKSLEIIASRLNHPVTYFLEDTDSGSLSAARGSDVDSLLEAGKELQLQDRYVDALELFQSALNRCPPTDYRKKGEIWLRIGHAYFQLNQFERARDHLLTAKEHFSISRDSENLARCLNDLGVVQARLFLHDDALESYREAYRTIQRDPMASPSYKLAILANLATTLTWLERYDTAIEVLNEAMAISAATGDYTRHGTCCQILGYVYEKTGNHDLAISWTQKAIEFYRTVGDTSRELTCLNNLASHLRKAGGIESSRRLTVEVLDRSTQLGVSEEIARAHVGMAEVEFDVGHFDLAYAHLIKAFSTAPTSDNLWSWTSAVVDCAERAPVPGELLALIEDVASKWKGDPRKLAEIHSNLGKIYSMMGDAEKANRHLSKSVDLFRNA